MEISLPASSTMPSSTKPHHCLLHNIGSWYKIQYLGFDSQKLASNNLRATMDDSVPLLLCFESEEEVVICQKGLNFIKDLTSRLEISRNLIDRNLPAQAPCQHSYSLALLPCFIHFILCKF